MTDRYAPLDAWIDAHFDEQVAFLQELIRVPTDTPPGNNTPHALRAAALLQGMGLEAEQHAPVLGFLKPGMILRGEIAGPSRALHGAFDERLFVAGDEQRHGHADHAHGAGHEGADGGGGERRTGTAVLGHLEAFQRRDHGAGFARGVEQDGGGGAAVHGAVVDAGEQDEGGLRRHLEGDRQEKGDGERRP